MNRPDTLKPRLMGKISAAVTHEIQNVLAIIKENAGLMDDLLTLTPAEEAEYLAQRLSRCLATVKKQVERGVGLTSGLNGLAHTADYDRQTVDAVELTRRLLALTERLSRNAGVETVLEPREADPRLETDPLQFQACLLLSMECLFLTSPPGSVISVAFTGTDSIEGVDIKAHHTGQQIPDISKEIALTAPWNELETAVPEINARALPRADGIHLTLN